MADFGTNIADDDKTVVPSPVATPITGPLAKYAKRVWIQLEDNDQVPPTGQFIGHNGNGFMLKSGVPALVPAEIVEILNHAVHLAPVFDQQTRQVIEYRPRLRFPYRRLTDEEVAAVAVAA